MLKKIQVSELTVGMFVHGFDESWLNHPFWRSKFLIEDAEVLQKVRESGIKDCWIDIAKGADIRAPSPVVVVPAAASQPPPKPQRATLADELGRAAQIRARATETTRHLFSQARLGRVIETDAYVELVDDVVESIKRNQEALCSLVRLKSADEYTYVHSVAVCALMVSLGRQLGMDDAECREAGLAGMLHDLGKAVMPNEILNKPGKLTDEEFAIIKTHPVRGYELLRESKGVSEVASDVCRHHHERMDGKGYPDGLVDAKISRIARMGAICDVYDAVTSDRPYKAGWDPAHALAQMASWQGHFDPLIFQSFVKCIGIYPTGSLVKLRSGRLAVVFEQSPKSLTRPRVKVFFSTKSQMPLRPEVVDLSSSQCSDQIESRESPEKWKFDYLNDLWDGQGALSEVAGRR